MRALEPRPDGGDDRAARKINHGHSSSPLVPALSCRPWPTMPGPSATYRPAARLDQARVRRDLATAQCHGAPRRARVPHLSGGGGY
jgi:hypothetical protein